MVRGEIEVPGDKSISQRAIIIGSIAQGDTVIKNFLRADDCACAIRCFEQMGVNFRLCDKTVVVQGVDLYGLKKPSRELYLGNSGTSMRLIMGILAAQNFESVLTGDTSLSSRPMGRVAEPLRLMGAKITGSNGGNFAPITIKGAKLCSITYQTPMPSAQVKSAILLAGIYAQGTTTVTEPIKSRDHTERMLSCFGADIISNGLNVSIKQVDKLKGRQIEVPGDISSAAFLICASAILPGSNVCIKNVGLNPTRIGIIQVLKRMGVDIKENIRKQDYEPIGEIICKGEKDIKPFVISPDEIPFVIDELPILMVVASFADGVSVIKGAGELRVKESDRIASMKEGLEKLGVRLTVSEDDVYIKGIKKGKSCNVRSFGDHRTAMSMAIAGLRADGPVIVENTSCVGKSFPDFEKILQQIIVVPP
jgi:3-phosphoshikimate 1-carboxyvinyltransferase